MRYSRQDALNQLPNNFSSTIHNKQLIIVGCGGIGSPLAELLVRGGFQTLTLLDTDLVDETNLQRQTFTEQDIATQKTTALKKRLEQIDTKSNIKIINNILTKTNIDKVCKNSDLILDCTDNFETRILINNYCEKNNKDWIYSGAVKTQIISCLFLGNTKLFKKVFPKPIIDESCCEVGVLASTTFASASLTYNQVLKYFIGNKEQVLIKQDLWTNQLFTIKIK
ncbi:MAG: ThiF family adenylyltransferase [Nanoarchaeales archaeon]|nr:ThiF family adenylyltransferase [Nanoarchaeales archaeon]